MRSIRVFRVLSAATLALFVCLMISGCAKKPVEVDLNEDTSDILYKIVFEKDVETVIMTLGVLQEYYEYKDLLGVVVRKNVDGAMKAESFDGKLYLTSEKTLGKGELLIPVPKTSTINVTKNDFRIKNALFWREYTADIGFNLGKKSDGDPLRDQLDAFFDLEMGLPLRYLIQVPGKVRDSNASSYDKESKALIWNTRLSTDEDVSIQFTSRQYITWRIVVGVLAALFLIGLITPKTGSDESSSSEA